MSMCTCKRKKMAPYIRSMIKLKGNYLDLFTKKKTVSLTKKIGLG